MVSDSDGDKGLRWHEQVCSVLKKTNFLYPISQENLKSFLYTLEMEILAHFMQNVKPFTYFYLKAEIFKKVFYILSTKKFSQKDQF